MNKLAIFVEGQTEQIFAEKLVLHLGAEANVGVRVERVTGGRRGSRRIVEIAGTSDPEGHDFFVLVVDCGQDERVKSDILDRYDGLVRANYEQIVGVRDVIPRSRDDIQRIRDGFLFRLPNDPLTPILILAIMEIEAWFLAEYSHFARIHAALTPERVNEELGFDPVNEDTQIRERPSKDLEDIYFLETVIYDKSRARVERTVDSLDFTVIQNELARTIDDLGRLVSLLQAFFSAE